MLGGNESHLLKSELFNCLLNNVEKEIEQKYMIGNKTQSTVEEPATFNLRGA